MSFSSLRLCLATVLMSLFVAACGGGDAGSAPPPTDLVISEGNGQVTLQWTPVAGVEYWVMYAPTSQPLNMKSPPGVHYWLNNVTSPLVIPGLTNGQAYSFAMDARINGGKGGAQTPSITKTPRLGGSTWSPGLGLDSDKDFRGLAYGAAADGSMNYITVGSGGAIFKSTYAITDNVLAWSVTASGLSVDFNAATYASGKFIAVGSGTSNNVVSSADLLAWTPASTAIASSLNAVATDGVTVVAVGDGGKIYKSTDGLAWNDVSASGVSDHLQGVSYLSSGNWVAVGTNGTLLLSPDGTSWTRSTATLPTLLRTATLRSVASVGAIWVMVGDAGVVTTSTDSGATWTDYSSSIDGFPNFYAVNGSSTTFSSLTQFLIVGASGTVYSSPNGTVWTQQSVGVSDDLYGLLGSATQYFAVGAAGTSRTSK
ncbi:MAG: hypothetical protein ACKOWD_02770 [Rhodoferax sp.]